MTQVVNLPIKSEQLMGGGVPDTVADSYLGEVIQS